MHPLETFLRQLPAIRGHGVDERSFYPPFAALFDELGRALRPRVRCITELKDQGANHPDAGLFTEEQCRRSDGAIVPGQKPERGVIEIKPPDHVASAVAGSAQIRTYLGACCG